MTSTQKILAVSTVLLTLTAVPAFQMASEGARLSDELTALQDQRGGLNQSGARDQPSSLARRRNKRTVYDLVNNANLDINGDDLLDEISQAMLTGNMMQMLKPFLMVPDLTDEKLAALIAEVKKSEKNPAAKEMALEALAGISVSRGNEGYQESLEKLLTLNGSSYSAQEKIMAWGAQNPTEALAWIEERKKSGEAIGTGTKDPYDELFGSLILGVLENDSAKGWELYASANETARKFASSTFAHSLADDLENRGIAETFSKLEEFLALEDDSKIQNNAAKIVAMAMREEPGGLDIFADVLARLDDPTQLSATLIGLVSQQEDTPLSERISWLEDRIAPEDFKNQMSIMFKQEGVNIEEAEQWLGAQTETGIIDQGRSGLTWGFINQEEFQSAYDHANQITEEGLRQSTLRQVAIYWAGTDRESALANMPKDLLEMVPEKLLKAEQD